MSPLAGRAILTAAQTRAAEAAATAAGTGVEALLERAGAGVARWVRRLGGGAPVLVLCGPGNNGGDGYVAARLLREAGVEVKVVALRPPMTGAARAAAARYGRNVFTLAAAPPAPVLVDALLGTGASRPLDSADAAEVARLAKRAQLRIAVDLPSGLDADTGASMGKVTACDVTLAMGALKPAHLLQPGAAACGVVRLVEFGLPLESHSKVRVLRAPAFAPPGPGQHKYDRGRVAVIAGGMPGASLLCATAALYAGAGYVTLLGSATQDGPAALVRRPLAADFFDDPKVGCVVVGPGLGRDDTARKNLALALRTPGRLVVDGDALRLVDPEALPPSCVLTPHGGEFDALFGTGGGSKLDRTLAAARRSGAVVVHKGADTVIAAPDGRAEILPGASGWLATAGSGDVLAGAIAARMGAVDPFAAACDGVWMHARAAALLGGGFIADELPTALGRVRAGA